MLKYPVCPLLLLYCEIAHLGAQTIDDYPRALREMDKQQFMLSRQRVLDLRNIYLFTLVRRSPLLIGSSADARTGHRAQEHRTH